MFSRSGLILEKDERVLFVCRVLKGHAQVPLRRGKNFEVIGANILRLFTYIGTLLHDGCFRMHIPRDITSIIFNGSESRHVDLWLMVRKMDGYIEIFEIGQRRIDDYIIELSFFNPFTGLKSPRYYKGV